MAISVSAVPQQQNKVSHPTSTADMDFETINHLIDCNPAEKQYNWLEEQRSTKVDKLTSAVYNNTRVDKSMLVLSKGKMGIYNKEWNAKCTRF